MTTITKTTKTLITNTVTAKIRKTQELRDPKVHLDKTQIASNSNIRSPTVKTKCSLFKMMTPITTKEEDAQKAPKIKKPSLKKLSKITKL